MIPESDSSNSLLDGLLMDVLMKLGSAQTILSALCRSIEKANPGIAVALVCPDRRSGKLIHIMAPNLPDRFSPSQLRLQYMLEGPNAFSAEEESGSDTKWSSGVLQGASDGSNLWWSGFYNLSAKQDVGLLAVWQSPESLPPVLDTDSIHSAMRLAMRIFGRGSAHTPFPYSQEVLPSVAHVN